MKMLLYRNFCLLNVLIICTISCLTHTDYLTHPVSQNTSLNLTVNFTCEATGVSLVFFYVGNIVAFENDIRIRGFYESNQQTINGTIKKRVLSVYAQKSNNNTKITCATIPDHIISENATLTIQGLLADVGDLKYTFINGSSVLLTWTPPYTLHNVPITGYYINDNIFTSNNSIVLSTTDPDPCILTNVTVSPVNDAGIGQTNSIDFYYQKAPISLDIFVISLFNRTRDILINIDVAKLCKGEYPNDIKIYILNTDDEIINTTSISPQVDNQLMIRGEVPIPNNLSTFIINISLSNYGGNFNNISSFVFDIPGPVVNIYSYVDNCTTVIITWDNPEDYRNELSVLYYNLSIIDEVNNNLFGTISVYGTSYQFEDEDIFIHRYTYVITGVNQLGEGISENKTFSYARVPRSVAESAAFSVLSYIQDNIIVEYNIPVNIECIGESPVNATVTVQCKRELHFMKVYLVEYTGQLTNLSEMLSVPQYQQCSLSIVFSNSIGTSELFVLPLYQQFCSQSENIGSISNLRACNDTPVIISVIFRATRNCSFINDDYHIIVFHHNLKMLKAVNYSSEVYDELFCLIHIELNDVSVENNNTIWQVWIRHTAQPNNLYCSNNFTLIVNNDPPDPVTFMINVNCTDVHVDWSIPFSPPGCLVKYYEIEFNDVFVTTNMLSYSWSNVSYNTLYTVSISAVNDAGTGNKSTNNTFISAIVPEVSIVNYFVLLSSENATLITINKVISDCPFSYPAHIQYNLTCKDNFVEYAYNTVFNSSTVEFILPLGLCNCIALITLDGDSQESFNFSTSLLIDVDFNVYTCEMLFITCSYSLPPFSQTDSFFWGCAVHVLNLNDSSIDKVISVNNDSGSWSMLSGGVYAITLFGCYNEDCSRNSSVCQEYKKVITISECGSAGNDRDLNNTLLLIITLIPILIVLVVVFIAILFIKKRHYHNTWKLNADNATSSQLKSLNDPKSSDITSMPTETTFIAFETHNEGRQNDFDASFLYNNAVQPASHRSNTASTVTGNFYFSKQKDCGETIVLPGNANAISAKAQSCSEPSMSSKVDQPESGIMTYYESYERLYGRGFVVANKPMKRSTLPDKAIFSTNATPSQFQPAH